MNKKNDVLKVQQRLTELSYMDKRYETGLMDSVTRASTKLFQARKWLEANGMISVNPTSASKFQLEEVALNNEYLVVVKKSEKREKPVILNMVH